jgi:hypothetical protein
MRHGVWSLKRDTSDASAKEMLMLTSLTTVPLTSPTTGRPFFLRCTLAILLDTCLLLLLRSSLSLYAGDPARYVSGANLMSLLHLKVDLYLRPFLFDELSRLRLRSSIIYNKRSIYLQSVSGANLMSLLHLKVDLYLRPFLFDELQSTRARRKESWHRRGQSSEEVC